MLQNKQNRLRRRAVRLLLLIAALFALSPTADAGFGTWDGTKYTVQMNGHPIGGWNGFKDMTKVDDNHYSVEFTPTTTDVMSFRLKINGKEYGPTDNNSNTTLSEGYQQAWLTDYSNWGKKEGAWLIYPSTGYKYTLHFWYSYDSQMKFNLEKTSIGASTIPSSLYFRTDQNSWGTPISMTKSSDGKTFSYTLSPYSANTTVKFHFRQNQNDWNGYQLFPNTDGASAVVGSNTIDNFKENGSDPNKAWAFKSTSSQPVTFTVDFSNASSPVLKITQDNGTPTVTYFIQGDFNSWGAGSYFSGSGNELTATVPNWKNSDGNGNNDGFLLKGSNSKNYSTGSVLNNKTAATVSEGTTHMTLNGAEGKEVTFTLTLNNGNPSTLTATWDEGGSGGDEGDYEHNPGTGWAIIGDWTGFGKDWTKGDAMTSDRKYSIVAKDNEDIYFRVKNGSTEYYPSENKNIQLTTGNYQWCTQVSTTNNEKAFYFTPQQGYQYEVVVEPSSDNTAGYRICVNNKGLYVPPVPETLPVYPIGIYSKDELDAYNEPTYYLLAYGLNNEKVTPEYQFTKATAADVARLQGLVSGATNKGAIAEGKYILELTMHNTTLRWSKGDNNWGEHPMSVVGFATPRAERETKVSGFKWNELAYDPNNAGNVNDFLKGYACVAVYDETANTLEIVKKDNGLLPFISLVGANWKQNTVANNDTAYTLPSRDDGKTHTTDDGWQDAWIQYNDKGEIAKDIEGNVMFNTMFPPRNVIKFATNFSLNGTDYNFTLGSDELVLLSTGHTKSGSGWKQNPPAEMKLNGVTVTNLTNNDNLALGEAVDFPNQLALDNGEQYTLYEVSDVWVNGKFKFWTGWTGGANNSQNAGANWANHTNWGHYKKQKADDKETVAEGTSAQQIHMKATVPLGDTDGDMIFEEPTYFKKLYFFYNKDHGIEDNKSVFIMLPARLGAQIAALSRESYTRGMYQPTLKDLGDLGSLKVLDVVITAHNYDSEEHELVTTVKLPENIKDLNKTASTFSEIFSGMEGENGGCVYDPYAYNNGNYYYNMVVTFDNPSAEGGKEIVEVKSNPFTIFRGEASATLKAYQLVKILGPTDGYNYLTYDPAGGDKVYKVKVTVEKPNNVIGGVNSISDEKALDSDINPKYVESKELTTDEITELNFGDGSKYRFSCKVLLVGNIVGQNITSYELLEPQLVNIENYIVGDRVEKDNVPTFTMDKEGRKDRFFYIVEPLIKNNGFGYSYTWKPDFMYSVKDAQGTTQTKSGKSEASVEGRLVLPEPKLIEEHSRLEMFYGDNSGDNTEGKDDKIGSFSYSVSGDNAVKLGEGARFQQVRKAIVIERPNVTLRYRALSKEYIVAKAKEAGIDVGYTEDTKAPLVVGLFDFKVGDETVVINNGSKYPNNEGLDWYLYHSTTKNPAYYYFKGFEGFEYGWDPEHNIGVTTYYEPREMTFSVRDAFKDVKFFPRWKDGTISGLRISQDAPVNALAEGTYNDAIGSSDGDNAVRITRSSLIYAETAAEGIKAGDLIEQVTVKVNLASETGNVVARVNKEGNPLMENGEEAADYREAGKQMQHTDFITAQAAAGTEIAEKGESDYFLVRIVDKTTQKDLMTPQAVSAKDMYDGKEFAVTANHGHWWDGQLETVKADPLYKRMQVRISHLYPFVAGTEGTTVDTTTPASAPRRAGAEGAAASDENVVIKSDAMLREFAGSDIPTAVIGVEDAMRDSVVAGVGFIEAHGEGVEIYGADGIKIAAGEGRHEVSAGVYVVRLNGRAEKVIVR